MLWESDPEPLQAKRAAAGHWVFQTFLHARLRFTIPEGASDLASPVSSDAAASIATRSLSPIFHTLTGHKHIAAPMYMNPAKSCVPRYAELVLFAISRAIASLKVLGNTNTIQVSDSADGVFLIPQISAQRGATTAQMVPATEPPMMAKNSRTP